MCKVFGKRKKCPYCGLIFLICSSCYRNHRYCSRACSQTARYENKKSSQRRYEKSENGKLRHRWRQNRYRKKIQNKKKVTHHTSKVSESHLIDPNVFFVIHQNINRNIRGGSNDNVPLKEIPKRKRFNLNHCYLCGRKMDWLKNRGDGF